MIKNLRNAMITAFLFTLALPVTAWAKGLPDGKVVFGGSYTQKSNTTLNGDLVVFGGVATLEPGSKVDGNIALLGGNLDVSGEVTGDIVGFGGLVELTDSAVVKGDVLTIGAHLQRDDGAKVFGEVNTAENGPLSMTFPGGVKIPKLEINFSPILNIIWFIFRVFIWSAIAVLGALFFPKQTSRIGETATRQPVVAGGIGLLTLIIIPFLELMLVVTIILIPVALLVVIILAVGWALSILGLGMEVGKRTAAVLNQDWPVAVSAGLGTFILVLVINGTRQVIPCVGWILPMLVILIGLGAVVLTRFGTQDYLLSPAISSVDAAIASQNDNPDSSVTNEDGANRNNKPQNT